eukprot:GEMP01057058.1.p1 GENE.GEMP01057058.1~~GEMP01057058.1.p1  ORF type:complete len:192 (-),score=18.72 GEMP01057058.1:2-577(-)
MSLIRLAKLIASCRVFGRGGIMTRRHASKLLSTFAWHLFFPRPPHPCEQGPIGIRSVDHSWAPANASICQNNGCSMAAPLSRRSWSWQVSFQTHHQCTVGGHREENREKATRPEIPLRDDMSTRTIDGSPHQCQYAQEIPLEDKLERGHREPCNGLENQRRLEQRSSVHGAQDVDKNAQSEKRKNMLRQYS